MASKAKWSWHDESAWCYLADEATAKAVQADLQSLAGCRLERDGVFVYASFVSESGQALEAVRELEAAGYRTEERA